MGLLYLYLYLSLWAKLTPRRHVDLSGYTEVHTMGRGVSRSPFIDQDGVQSHIILCSIGGGHSGTGRIFSLSLSVLYHPAH